MIFNKGIIHVSNDEVTWTIIFRWFNMMIDSRTFREAFEHAMLEEIIKGRDRLIREIRWYEKGKMHEGDYCINQALMLFIWWTIHI